MITENNILDCKAGQDDSLTIVQLFTEPTLDQIRNNQDLHRRVCYDWCRDNIGPEDEQWARDGVTVYSWRILFADKQDAVAFKLTFGL